MTKENACNSQVFVLEREFSRMGPDDHDQKDVWIEEFTGCQRVPFNTLKEINIPEKVVFWANSTFDETDYLSCEPDRWEVFSPKMIKVFEDNRIPMNKFPVTLIKGNGNDEISHDGYARYNFWNILILLIIVGRIVDIMQKIRLSCS